MCPFNYGRQATIDILRIMNVDAGYHTRMSYELNKRRKYCATYKSRGGGGGTRVSEWIRMPPPPPPPVMGLQSLPSPGIGLGFHSKSPRRWDMCCPRSIFDINQKQAVKKRER